MSLKTEIISHEGFVFDKEAFMVVLPTKSGKIGIMKNHEEIITQLEAGEILIYNNYSKIKQKININSGFAKVFNNILTITISQ